MARAATRSQRQPSQSQQPRGAPRGTQNGRTQRAPVEEDDDEEEAGEGDDDDAMQEDGEEGGSDDTSRKAHDLVRLALFSEQRRIPLRRDDISKKVLGAKSRAFGEVFSRAQDILRKTFGMEMVELRPRAEAEDSTTAKEKEAMNIKKKAAVAGTKTFILRSVLDPGLIQAAVARDDELLQVEQAEKLVASDDEVEYDNTLGTYSTGSIFAWHSSDQLGSIGILYVILALILVNGRSLSDNTLRANLKTLRLLPTTYVPVSNQATHQDMTMDAYLNQLVRQSFIERVRVGEVKGAKKRGRAPAATQGEDNANMIEWRWGARAISEVGETGIAKFVAEFMVHREYYGDDEGGSNETEKVQKNVEKMLQGIEKAAGSGKLLDITGK
ncbi:MAGE-domain-containing protein [Cristinia sonorae]|uniref:MAGE-domain-containing protein n=1 Tax=Cristinia sonorae TaxID=1940300 RepID=A0A8K0UVM6_9AGAR|nr:MAGE-domain-containing protein [Cristinia sonorae]